MNHRSRGEKEEALEERVIERVQSGPREAEHGNERVSVRDPQRTRPDAEQDDPDVLHAVEREQSFQVVLRESPHDSQHAGDRAEREDDPAPPWRRRTEQHDRPQQAVDPHLDDHTGHQCRHVRRSGCVCFREPNVKWDEPSLDTETHERQQDASVGRMTHHTERSSLYQLMVFFNCHVHGKKAAECDDGPPA